MQQPQVEEQRARGNGRKRSRSARRSRSSSSGSIASSSSSSLFSKSSSSSSSSGSSRSSSRSPRKESRREAQVDRKYSAPQQQTGGLLPPPPEAQALRAANLQPLSKSGTGDRVANWVRESRNDSSDGSMTDVIGRLLSTAFSSGRASARAVESVVNATKTLVTEPKDMELWLNLIGDRMKAALDARNYKLLLAMWYVLDSTLKRFKRSKLLDSVEARLPFLLDTCVPWSAKREEIKAYEQMIYTWRTTINRELFNSIQRTVARHTGNITA